MNHETKIVRGKPLGDSKRWIAQCSCGRRSGSWLDCDDACADLEDMHPPGVLLSDPRDAEIAALRGRVAELEAVERAARSEIAYMDETKAAHPDAVVEPTLNELRAALAALEVPRG